MRSRRMAGSAPNACHAEDDKQGPKRYDNHETAAAAAPES